MYHPGPRTTQKPCISTDTSPALGQPGGSQNQRSQLHTAGAPRQQPAPPTSSKVQRGAPLPLSQHQRLQCFAINKPVQHWNQLQVNQLLRKTASSKDVLSQEKACNAECSMHHLVVGKHPLGLQGGPST